MAVDTRLQPEENPLTEGLERLPVPPTTLVIFGATGDLAHRKLLPALYNLAHEGALPERFELIGLARREKGKEDFRCETRESIVQYSRREPDDDVLNGLLDHVYYIPANFDDPEGYKALAQKLDELDAAAGQPLNRDYYLSTAPEFFPVIVEQLKAAGLHRHDKVDVRCIIEKPFGTDLASARALQKVVSDAFRERQVFRIDHYLGKETVQNMMAFRFSNMLFEPIWNRNYIDHIQITGAEDIGIGTRAGYYDQAGALRDLVQNHMLQLVALTCMEPPASFQANKVRDEKVKVFTAITPPEPAETVRAQYTAGNAGGDEVPGYLEEEGVPEDSHTETYAALRLEVHNWRWAGVPIYLRTGKRLARKVTEIAVQLKPVPHMAFQTQGSVGVLPNQLILTMQPI
jgi:glucose-6-phosphate 1-dehydrogenase